MWAGIRHTREKVCHRVWCHFILVDDNDDDDMVASNTRAHTKKCMCSRMHLFYGNKFNV